MLYRKIMYLGITVLFGLVAGATVHAQSSLLNVSYDVSRELYKDMNPAFTAWWQAQGNPVVTISQSHGGSSKQALAVASGLEADVITMNQSPDIDMLVDRGLIAKGWRDQFPYQASPYTTTSVFLVRKGNPKQIQDWGDLTVKNLKIIMPNPKTSGNGRYTYAAAWGYALDKTGTEEGAETFVRALLKNVPVLDGGSRGATTTFTQRGVGDALVTFENEAILIASELGADAFDVVYPSISIDVAAPVAVVGKVTENGARQSWQTPT
jgi:sulfate/thiosulfate transport system substrate-binding protein